MDYPKHVFSKESGPSGLIVDSAEAHEALGEGWYESPADIPAEAPADAVDVPEADDAPKPKGRKPKGA